MLVASGDAEGAFVVEPSSSSKTLTHVAKDVIHMEGLMENVFYGSYPVSYHLPCATLELDMGLQRQDAVSM